MRRTGSIRRKARLAVCCATILGLASCGQSPGHRLPPAQNELGVAGRELVQVLKTLEKEQSRGLEAYHQIHEACSRIERQWEAIADQVKAGSPTKHRDIEGFVAYIVFMDLAIGSTRTDPATGEFLADSADLDAAFTRVTPRVMRQLQEHVAREVPDLAGVDLRDGRVIPHAANKAIGELLRLADSL